MFDTLLKKVKEWVRETSVVEKIVLAATLIFFAFFLFSILSGKSPFISPAPPQTTPEPPYP